MSMATVKISTGGMTISNSSENIEEELKIPSSIGPRRKAREIALQGLYAAELSQNTIQEVMSNLRDIYQESDFIFTFARELLTRAKDCKSELDQYIQAKTTNWDFERIAIIDKIILRIAICEFLYFNDIPPKVSIDEAIELSKCYSTEQSGRFVNGILDAILNDLKKSKKINKSGRGLMDSSSKDRL